MGGKLPGVPDNPKIEFINATPNRFKVDASDQATTVVRMGRWDRAFVTTEKNQELLAIGNGNSNFDEEDFNLLRNSPKEEGHFVGSDSQRFYIRLTDPAARGRSFVEVNWRTLKRDGSVLDAPRPEIVTLLRVPNTDPPMFVSRALMLVAFDDDFPRQVHTGLPANHPESKVRARATDVTRGNVDYRLRHAHPRGKVEVEYQSPSNRVEKAQRDVFADNELRTVRIRIVVLHDKSLGRPVLDLDPSSSLWNEDIKLTMFIFSQAGIVLASELAGAKADGEATVLGKKFEATVLKGDTFNPKNLDIDGQREVAKRMKAPAGVSPIPAQAQHAVLTVGDLSFDLQIGWLDPVTETTGVEARLGNLGCYSGQVGDQDGEDLPFAVELFQRDSSLPVTGVPDAVREALRVRRANAIFGLLTRDTAMWEQLYTQPFGGDDWRTRTVQAMLAMLRRPASGEVYYDGVVGATLDQRTRDAIKRFQEDNALAADSVAGPITRGHLFTLYMDAICVDSSGKPFRLAPADFLGEGKDPGGKATRQGCSEFNPVLLVSTADDQRFAAAKDKSERNAKNAPNRRVVVYLFRPGTRVGLEGWPCPRTAEGPMDCKKQFWPDGERRRKPSESERQYAQTRDTMACRFYEGFARRSPCEGIVSRFTSISIRLFDGARKPMRGARYRLRIGNQVRRSVTNKDAFLVARAVEVPNRVAIEWGLDPSGRDEDGGPLFLFKKELFLDFDSGSNREQQVRRLHNLGYPADRDFAGNVRAFQRDHGLEESAEMDPTTSAELKRAHDELDPKATPSSVASDSTANAPA